MARPINQLARYNFLAANVTKDGSNRIAQVNDIGDLGNNYHLLQATDDNKPIWTDAVLNGKPVSRHNGTSQYMTVDFGTTYSQPMTIVFVQKCTNTSNSVVIICDNFGTGGISTSNISNKLSFGAGTDLGYTKATPYSDFIQSVGVFNTTTSVVYENAVSKATGNIGSGTLKGLTLGAYYAGNNYYFKGDFAEVIIYKRILTPLELANLNNALYTDYAIGSEITPLPDPIQPALTPTSSTYNGKNTDISIAISGDWSSITSITDSFGTTLTPTTHYTVSGTTLTIKAAYLYTLADTSVSVLTVNFDSGNPATYTITLAINPVLSVSKIIYSNVTTDLTATLTLYGKTLTSIVDNYGTTLTATTHYTLVGSTLTIKAAYLASIDEFAYLTFNFDYDNDVYLTLAYANLFMFEGLTFQTFDYQCAEFYMDAFCINVFDFTYISNEIHAITIQELTRSRPLIQTDKRMLINPTPDRDLPASIYIDDKLYMNPTPDNKRPTELK